MYKFYGMPGSLKRFHGSLSAAGFSVGAIQPMKGREFLGTQEFSVKVEVNTPQFVWLSERHREVADSIQYYKA